MASCILALILKKIRLLSCWLAADTIEHNNTGCIQPVKGFWKNSGICSKQTVNITREVDLPIKIQLELLQARHILCCFTIARIPSSAIGWLLVEQTKLLKTRTFMQYINSCLGLSLSNNCKMGTVQNREISSVKLGIITTSVSSARYSKTNRNRNYY